MTGSLPRLPSQTPEPADSPVVTVLPYVLLAALAACTAVVERAAGTGLLIDLGLCAATAIWMLAMFTLRPNRRNRPVLRGAFVTGIIVLWAALVLRDPWFGCFAPAAYLYSFRLLSWPGMLPGVAAVAVVAGTAQSAGLHVSGIAGVACFSAVLLANVVPMLGYAWYARATARRHDERGRMVDELGAANRRLAAATAENAALQTQLLARAREAGRHDERQRMAREIHDTLAQGLIGIITQLEAAERGDDSARRTRAAGELARASLVEARRSVHALRPEPLECGALGEALDRVAQRWADLHHIAIRVTTTGAAHAMPEEAETALLRTVQEALANVARHAEARRVGVTLSYLDGQVALDVRDDGRGFDIERRTAAEGFGLTAMRQRIEALAGSLHVESEPGAGTAISARIPAVTA
ncbi:sensor histidine kinase [Nocardia sp. NPDC051570]|uniref:sensor histidine kinase n=1 Tax=Nocardia sp. NPDC051570 TaxID=3364324 RepID=UPI0037BA0F30